MKLKSSWVVKLAMFFAASLLCINLANYFAPLPEFYPYGAAPVVLSAKGHPLRTFSDQQGNFRYHILPDQVSPFYLQTLFNYEDRWFYWHFGVNPFAIVRAAAQWAVSGRVISGGSTITMQVARLLQPHKRTVFGKLRQILRAMQLEWNLSKEEILTLYLNLAPFGGNIVGVEAAARYYFDKPALQLNRNEATLLAVLPQKPSRFRPDRHPELAKLMRDKVIVRLEDAGVLTAAKSAMMQAEPIKLYLHQRPMLAPLLARALKKKTHNQPVIRTSIDYDIQINLAKLFNHLASKLPAKSSVSAIVVHNPTGQVIAYQGSLDMAQADRFGHLDMIHAIRSPGSTLKPFIYGMGIDKGIIHSESLLSDIPSNFYGYKPKNLSKRFHGAISVADALKRSLNVPVIQVLNRIRVSYFDQQMRQAGIKFHHKVSNLTIALGGTGTSLWELVKGYRSFAQGGVVRPLSVQVDPEKALSAADQQHEASAQPEQPPLMSAAASWIIWRTLADLSAPDRIVPNNRREIGWKTGTSYGYRDFWSVGVSADYTVGVWVGRPDSSPIIGYLGATQAAPIMFDIFDLLPRDQLRLEQPADVVLQMICWPGGKAVTSTAKANCLSQRKAMTKNGITPPSLQSNGRFVVRDVWPDQLALWQKKRKMVSSLTNTHRILKIIGVKTGQHFFSDQIDTIDLKSTLDDLKVEWYVNHKRTKIPVIDLKQYTGNVTITACLNNQCDQKNISVHKNFDAGNL